MGKGSYLGGSSVISFAGAFTGASPNKLTQATNVDAHLSQKEKRDRARTLATGEKKKLQISNAEKKAAKRAREKYKQADKTVVVEHRRGGEIVATRTIKQS
ncbi:MAG: hypothetical protein K2W81_02440 [Sphingomonas sp.]|uniref:hypothetical protein n=1 Tax=Sphingomonas sp. TaxID=28214 RepID=UPI0025CFE18B|nr:hypothetical protein [Sphingomonas sp.]MBY0282807.1 hypothetical protein [Sphingomonas sp.]